MVEISQTTLYLLYAIFNIVGAWLAWWCITGRRAKWFQEHLGDPWHRGLPYDEGLAVDRFMGYAIIAALVWMLIVTVSPWFR